MIVYFSDRQMQVMGLASTNLPDGFAIIEDLKTEEIETGVATFSCRIGFNDENRLELESMTNAGNFLLRSHDGENEFYTIIDTEIDTKNKTINIYAEDAGLDLLNEIAGEFEATEAHNVVWYINKYIAGSGFEIGINEVSTSSTRKLKWEGEDTVTARLASIATQFGGFEISYSFDIDGLAITKKYVNIHKERGKDVGITLRLNQDIDKIITTKSVANLATAFLCEGGVPDKAEEPITFSSAGYTWKDADNDFYIEGDLLKSRKAIQKWSREALKLYKGDGVIIRPYSYNTTDPATLRAHAVTELKKVCDMEVNYEVDIKELPQNVKIGDRINIVDDGGELYLSTRVLVLETSVVDQEHSAVLGEHLIKTSGISQKVADLAEQFAKTSVSAAQALSVANAANTIAEAAKTQAEEAAQKSGDALTAAGEAQTAAQNANTSANEANTKADAAQEAVSGVEATVSEMEKVVTEAEKLAKSAQESATTAATQSAEAKTAASNAVTNANEAKSAAEEAKTNAESAISTASTASTQADEAKTQAKAASDVAAAAKLDSEQAQKDVAAFGESLETFEATMKADYARKTDLTETTATLQAQITINANELSITHEKVVTIDETANNAKELAANAQKLADDAQATANLAAVDAKTAQAKATEAQEAATAAQTEANTAQAAADAAQAALNQAEADLASAKAHLETVKNKAGATEQEIADAQAAVDTAQEAADQAQVDAATAIKTATDAKTNADLAATHAANVKAVADKAKEDAEAAQKVAYEASTAKQKADEAYEKAATAQGTAQTAIDNAKKAQNTADKAIEDAEKADKAAQEAAGMVEQAKTNLDTAKQTLAETLSKADATEEEITEAEKAVEDAQAAVDAAIASAAEAAGAAALAAEFAAIAQNRADEAKKAADNAKKAADEAKEAADKAQADVDDLVIRVTSAETEIAKSNEQIALRATKAEVDAIVIGGRNLLLNSKGDFVSSTDASYGYWDLAADTYSHGIVLEADQSYTLSFDWSVDWGSVTPVTDVMASVGCGNTAGAFTHDIGATNLKNLSTKTSGSVAFTFKPTAAHLEGRPYFAMRPIRYNSEDALDGTSWTIKNVKLEKGDKATDWEPAPEDIDSKFLNYNTKEEATAEMSIMADNITSTVTQSTDDKVAGLKQETMTEIQQLKDKLSMLVVGEDGLTLMEQTGDGWSFNLADIPGDIEDIKNALAENAEYIKFTTTDDGKGGTEPCIELGVSQKNENTGEISDGKYKVLITNTRIIFKEGSATPTYISNETLVSEKVEVTQELHHTNAGVTGSFVWKMRANGNLGLSWKGV